MVRGPRTLLAAFAASFPHIGDPRAEIVEGRVAVDGRPNTNPASVVGRGSTVTRIAVSPLRGEAKLRAAFSAFDVSARGKVALDVGAAAGGFTRVLLAEGATRVYAVDAGHGQLRGSLRQDPRVVNLEATNLGELDARLVPNPIQLFTLDLSYLSLRDAAPQLDRVPRQDMCDLIALVKPMFELHLPEPPVERQELTRALQLAVDGVQAAGWRVLGQIESPVRGAHGAAEFLVHATRALSH